MDSLVLEQTEQGARYCRSVSQARLDLQNKLVEFYHKDSTVNPISAQVFPSGMCAISTIMNLYATGGKTFYIIGNELYCDTSKVCRYQKRYNNEFDFTQVDVRDTNKIFELFHTHKDSLKMFYFEAATNPSGQVFDFEKLKELKEICPNCIFVVDNTWMTAISFNPFQYGADIVIESMTKYISAGTCIGGMMIGKNNIMEQVLTYIRINGLFVGSDHCKLFLEGLQTLNQRIENVSALSLEVARYLESRKDKVSRVMYPFLESHPTYAMAKKYFKYGPGVIWFHVPFKYKSLSKTKNVLSDNSYLPYKTSFGSAESKIDQWPELGKACIYEYGNFENKVKGAWIRLAIGYESNKEVIVKGLEEIFEKVEV